VESATEHPVQPQRKQPSEDESKEYQADKGCNGEQACDSPRIQALVDSFIVCNEKWQEAQNRGGKDESKKHKPSRI
jgi:hypothetical protein